MGGIVDESIDSIKIYARTHHTINRKKKLTPTMNHLFKGLSLNYAGNPKLSRSN